MISSKLLYLVAVLAALGLASSACGKDSDVTSPAPANLDGRVFLSTELDGHDLVAGSTVRLEFEDGRIRANGGCNGMGGDYSVADDDLVVGDMASTQMGCEQDLMDQDLWLSDFLTGRPAVELSGDELTLAKDGVTMRLADESSVRETLPLEGTKWTLHTLIQNDAASSVPEQGKPGITIEDGNIFVRTGCNTGRGTVTVEGDKLTVSPLATTKMACKGASEQVESAVLGVLQSNPTFTIEYDQLTITSPDGTSGLGLVGTK